MKRAPRHPVADAIATALVKLDTITDTLRRVPSRGRQQYARNALQGVRASLRRQITWRHGSGWVINL